MQPKGAKSLEKLRRSYRKTDKESEKIDFLRKFDLVCGGARLIHFIAKRLGGRLSYFSSKEVI